MPKSYDTNLGNILGSSSRRRFALNPEFGKWNFFLWSEIVYKAYCIGDSYDQCEQAAELYTACLSHSASCTQQDGKPTTSLPDDVIALVHPFWLSLENMSYINDNKLKEEYNNYLQNIIRLFGEARKKGFGVVLLDTAQHYAAASSLLVERGLVDRVIFTQSGRGIPMETKKLRELSGKNIYLAGGYNDYCLRSASESFLDEGIYPDRLFAIQGAISDRPFIEDYLQDIHVSIKDAGDTIVPEKIIMKREKNDPVFFPENQVSDIGALLS